MCLKFLVTTSSEENTQGAFTPGLCCIFPRQMTCSEPLCIFPSGRFVFTLHYGKVNNLTGLSSCEPGWALHHGTAGQQAWTKTWRYETALFILTSHLLAPVAWRNILGLFVPVAANEPLQIRLEWSRVHLFQGISARSFSSASERDCCVHVCPNEQSQRGHAPLLWNNIDLGVKAPWKPVR